MAENKKAIIVYADWIHQFENLTDEEAGKLIKHFFRYINDLNPIPPDRITEVAFDPIKTCLKRDLDKWEKTISERSINGRLGNLKRYNLDLFNQVQSNLISIEDAENIAKHRKTSLPDSIVTKTVANIAVNDSVSVNVNNTTSVTYSAEKAIEICLKDLEWISEVEKNYNLKSIHFNQAFNDFKSHCISIGRNEDRTIYEFKYHFVNWVKKKKEAKVKETVKDRL
jgi:hypothetical protein